MLLQVLKLSYWVPNNTFLMLLQDGLVHTAEKIVQATSAAAFLLAPSALNVS
jgi:hypothetical protein